MEVRRASIYYGVHSSIPWDGMGVAGWQASHFRTCAGLEVGTDTSGWQPSTRAVASTVQVPGMPWRLSWVVVVAPRKDAKTQSRKASCWDGGHKGGLVRPAKV